MRTIIDEGVAASVMSLSCWKGLGSPMLSQYTTMLTTFDGISFLPHEILPYLEFQLGGKFVAIKVEMVDAPLDYNILLVQNYIYAMNEIILYFFRVV